MHAEHRAIAGRLLRELRKDLPFFASCGAIVGALTLLQHYLKQFGVSPREPWADALLADLVSLHAFGLIFLGLLALGTSATCLDALQLSCEGLEKIVIHVDARLTQMVSSIISFTSGLLVVALLHAALTKTSGGLALAIYILQLDCLLLIGFFSASIVARRIEPFNRWPAGGTMLAVSVAGFVWLILRGAK